MQGKTYLVTGATSGIGLYTARGLALCGAHVVIACRTPSKAQELVQQWQQEHQERPHFSGQDSVLLGYDVASCYYVR